MKEIIIRTDDMTEEEAFHINIRDLMKTLKTEKPDEILKELNKVCDIYNEWFFKNTIEKYYKLPYET